MNFFQYTFAAIILLSLFSVIRRYRKHGVNPLSLVSWMFIWIFGLVVILFPGVSVFLSNLFGIARGVDFIIYTSIIFSYYLLFQLYSKLNQYERKLKEIATKFALLDDKLNDVSK